MMNGQQEEKEEVDIVIDEDDMILVMVSTIGRMDPDVLCGIQSNLSFVMKSSNIFIIILDTRYISWK